MRIMTQRPDTTKRYHHNYWPICLHLQHLRNVITLCYQSHHSPVTGSPSSRAHLQILPVLCYTCFRISISHFQILLMSFMPCYLPREFCITFIYVTIITPPDITSFSPVYKSQYWPVTMPVYKSQYWPVSGSPSSTSHLQMFRMP